MSDPTDPDRPGLPPELEQFLRQMLGPTPTPCCARSAGT
jgi:hypothetical protein